MGFIHSGQSGFVPSVASKSGSGVADEAGHVIEDIRRLTGVVIQSSYLPTYPDMNCFRFELLNTLQSYTAQVLLTRPNSSECPNAPSIY